VTAPSGPETSGPPALRLRRIGIDTYQEPILYMRSDCHVCRAEGFEAQTRILARVRDREIIATVNVVTSRLLDLNEAGLSEAAWRQLDAREGEHVRLSHAPQLPSLGHVRAKIFGNPLDEDAFQEIIGDIAAGRYSDMHLAAFVTACADNRIDRREITAMTRAMIRVGERLTWAASPVADKHCVGGLPGNRTTPILVPIVAACGLTIPKTSSRAITSPAGTADAMETLAPVDLDAARMRRVVEQEGGCIVWGGAVRLSPADDIMIRAERALDIDGEGQLVASVLSKKVAAGSTHVVIDIPTGPTAKTRTPEAAASLRELLVAIGHKFGMKVKALVTDGTQPVGCGIGPALEAADVLAVLRNAPDAPGDLRERSLLLAGALLELAGRAPAGKGIPMARAALDDGRAWRKFQAICRAQGGMRDLPRAAHTRPVTSARKGCVASIDNRRLSRTAKLAGAPKAPAAGLVLHTRIGTTVTEGQPLFTIHAESRGELDYALEYVRGQPDIVRVEDP